MTVEIPCAPAVWVTGKLGDGMLMAKLFGLTVETPWAPAVCVTATFEAGTFSVKLFPLVVDWMTPRVVMPVADPGGILMRSEERRVGKECSSRRSWDH